MAFGRFNPPTIGHELLVKAVKKLAQQKKADHVIYASRSQDAKKNPLSVDKKVKYLNLMFKNTHFVGASDTVRTFIEAAKELNKRYKNLVMVAGSDRVPEFNRLLNTYNGKEFKFDTIEVISAGERDPDADDATGMSASKMRAIAVKGNYAEFKRGLPSSVREIDGRRLMNDIRDGMGLDAVKEQIILVKDELREKYFRGEIFNEGDIVECGDEKYTIVKRGSNHLLLREGSGALVSKWIHDVQPTEEKDMNESLTDKTLRPTDKIKVARIIATMLGVENAETSSNPENLINQALRRVRTKALNPEALNILDKMLNLATEQGIQYDATLKPTKLKEDKVNRNSNYNIAKDVLRFSDFKRLKKIQEHEESDNDDKKDNESDHDHEHNDNEIDHSEVGHTLVGPGKQDNLRRRKIAYHLGEQHKIPHIDMSAYEDEAGHENTAQHIITSPEHTAKQKKLAKSFIDKMSGSVAEAVSARLKLADALRREGEKRKASEERAKLMMQQSKEKQALADQHKKEKENLTKEETEIEESTPYYNKPSFLKRMSHVAKQERQAREKKEQEQKKQVKEEIIEEGSTSVYDTHVRGSSDYHAIVKKHGTEKTKELIRHLKTERDSLRKHSSDWAGPAHLKKHDFAIKGLTRALGEDLVREEEVEICETADAGLAAKAAKSGISIGTLRKVYRRGVAAWNSGHRPGTTPQQWGMARVNSYITKGKGTYHGADKDLREQEELEENNLPEVPKDKESGLPKKYVAGLSASTAKARAAHWDRMDKKSDSDPSAYAPAPGDATAETKPSKHTLKYRAMFGEDMDEELYEACWDTHKQVGMKKKGDRMVPDCVPKNEEIEFKDDVCDVCGKSPCECENEGQDQTQMKPNFDPFFKEDEDEIDFAEPSDDEIEKMADELTDDDYLDAYDEDELGVIDDETGEELEADEEEEKKLKESALMEVLSRIERMKAVARIRRTKAKRERATKIALKRYSNTATINKRARRLAIKLMKKRLTRGRDPSKLSVGEKERIERIIERRKAVIGRIAMRLAPRVRKVEKARLSHSKYTQGSPNVTF